MVKQLPPILEVNGVLLSSDILTEYFCCDYERCRGICCVEGDAGAPVSVDEIGEIEESLDAVWVTSLHQRKASLTVKELPTPIPMAIW